MTNESDVHVFPNSSLYLLTCLIYSTESTSLKIYIVAKILLLLTLSCH